MNEITEQVINRMMQKKIACPDCGKILDSVVIEVSEVAIFKIDYEKKTIPEDNKGVAWCRSDRTFRCPHCDSLNVDSLFSAFVCDV